MLDKIGRDKLLHLAACATVAATVKWAAVAVGLPLWGAAVTGAAVALAAGTLKEWDDALRGGEFDRHDLVADAVGALLGAL